jgi:hypothetical protein
LGVAVPIPEHGVQGDEGEEAIDVQGLFEKRPAGGEVGCLRGFSQGDAIGLFAGAVARVGRQLDVDVFEEATVVKIAGGFVEILFEKAAVPAFNQDVEAEIAPVEFDRGVSGARGGDAGFQKDFAGELFADVGRVLDGIVEA